MNHGPWPALRSLLGKDRRNAIGQLLSSTFGEKVKVLELLTYINTLVLIRNPGRIQGDDTSFCLPRSSQEFLVAGSSLGVVGLVLQSELCHQLGGLDLVGQR